MSTSAQAANLTAFKINGTLIGEVTEFSQAGTSNKTATVTNLQSTAEEFISTILAPGSYSLTFNRVSADAGQVALVSAFGTKALTPFTVTLPAVVGKTNGDSYAFSALVETFEALSSVSPEKQVQSKVTLKVSGPITLTVAVS